MTIYKNLLLNWAKKWYRNKHALSERSGYRVMVYVVQNGHRDPSSNPR